MTGPAFMGPAAAWSLVSAARSRTHRRHHAEHVLGHLAMLYMALSMARSTHDMEQMAGMSQSIGLPRLTGTLIIAFTADAVIAGTRVLLPAASGARSHPHFSGQQLLWARQLPDACHIALALGMTIMLIAL